MTDFISSWTPTDSDTFWMHVLELADSIDWEHFKSAFERMRGGLHADAELEARANQTHDHEAHGCRYIGFDLWDCGAIDN